MSPSASTTSRSSCKTLSEEEREERAQFAYEACAGQPRAPGGYRCLRHFGWDVEEARKRKLLDGFVMSTFRNLLFQRVIPNLKRIGLMTESVRPKFEELGILDFENLPNDGDIDWKAMERPLDVSEQQSAEQKELQAQMESFLHGEGQAVPASLSPGELSGRRAPPRIHACSPGFPAFLPVLVVRCGGRTGIARRRPGTGTHAGGSARGRYRCALGIARGSQPPGNSLTCRGPGRRRRSPAPRIARDRRCQCLRC